MKIKGMLTLPAVVVAGLAIGYAMSRHSNRESIRQNVDSITPASRVSQPSRSTESAGAPPIQRKPASQVVLPVASVGDVLKSGYFSNCNFLQLSEKMNSALTLLRATDQEREQVMELWKQTETEIYEAEQRLLKPVVSGNQIRIDINVMAESIDAIIERTQTALKTILPADTAKTLVSSIDWSQFYFSGYDSSMNQVTLRIYPDATESNLRASEITPWGGEDTSLDPSFKHDGTAIPADHVFSKRWQRLLTGIALLPE